MSSCEQASAALLPALAAHLFLAAGCQRGWIGRSVVFIQPFPGVFHCIVLAFALADLEPVVERFLQPQAGSGEKQPC